MIMPAIAKNSIVPRIIFLARNSLFSLYSLEKCADTAIKIDDTIRNILAINIVKAGPSASDIVFAKITSFCRYINDAMSMADKAVNIELRTR